MAQFHCKTKLFFGSGSLSALSALQIKRLLVVTDQFFEQNGLAEEIAARCQAKESKTFSQVTPDPTLELIAAGTAILQQFEPDTVLALGGGSPIDCAKAMVYFGGKPVQFVAIPTTSGTGSEVTSFSIVTAGGVKHPLVDSSLCPDIAILDEDLLQTLPQRLIADAGYDVLSHCMEAIASTNHCAITDALAQKAFCCTLSLLPRSFAGETACRGEIHLAATMAGMAFDNAGLGICHSLSHALGGLYHVPHGRLNAILLPAVAEYNATAVLPAYCALAKHCGLAGATDKLSFKNLLFALRRLRKTLGMPTTLREAGISAPDLSAAAGAALKDACSSTNPISPTKEALETILRSVM